MFSRYKFFLPLNEAIQSFHCCLTTYVFQRQLKMLWYISYLHGFHVALLHSKLYIINDFDTFSELLIYNSAISKKNLPCSTAQSIRFSDAIVNNASEVYSILNWYLPPINHGKIFHLYRIFLTGKKKSGIII